MGLSTHRDGYADSAAGSEFQVLPLTFSGAQAATKPVFRLLRSRLPISIHHCLDGFLQIFAIYRFRQKQGMIPVDCGDATRFLVS